MVDVDLRIDPQKTCVGKSLEYVFKFTKQSINNIIEEVMYDLIITQRTFTLTLNGILVRALKSMRKVAIDIGWIC